MHFELWYLNFEKTPRGAFLLSLVLLIYRPTLLNQPQAVRWGSMPRIKYKIALATNTTLAHFNARPQEIFTHKFYIVSIKMSKITTVYQSQVNRVNRWIIQILLNVFWCNFFFVIPKPFQIHTVFLWLWFILPPAACRQQCRARNTQNRQYAFQVVFNGLVEFHNCTPWLVLHIKL